MESTVSEFLVRLLKSAGVRYVCGVPAGQLIGFMDALSRDPDLVYVTTRHEEAAGHMADAISRVTPTLGVCFGTTGPGATNLLPGVAAAWADNVPLLALTGNNQSFAVDPAHDNLQDADHVALYRPVTKWNAVLRDPERVPELVFRAIRTATSGRPGPVHLDLPVDVGFRRVCFEPEALRFSRSPSRPAGDPTSVERAAAALRAARRPLLLAGGGVVRSGATEAFRELLDLTGFPATTTLMGLGVVPPDHPSNVGSGGWYGGYGALRALQDADVLLAVGCKFSTWTVVDKPPVYPRRKGQMLLQVDIDPEMIGKNARIDLGIVGDARVVLEELVECLSGGKLAMDPRWPEILAAERDRYRAVVDGIAAEKAVGTDEPPNEAAAARALARAIDPEAIVAFDGGQTMEWAHTFLPVREPERHLFNPGMGHLGFGQPFANAAKLAHPEREVVNVAGDGAFGCTVQELETAVRYALRVIHVVFNDAAWGMYRPFEEQVFRNPNMGTRLTPVDFARVAQGFGAYGERVTRLEELPAAFVRARASGKPAVLDVPVRFTPHPMDRLWLEIVFAGVELPAPLGQAAAA